MPERRPGAAQDCSAIMCIDGLFMQYVWYSGRSGNTVQSSIYSSGVARKPASGVCKVVSVCYLQ